VASSHCHPDASLDHGQQTLAEEIANAVTHGLSAIAAVVGLVVLVVYAASEGDPWRVVTFSIFGACLVILYAASTCYHAVRPGPLKRTLRVLDHSAIYLLIAGSYTPFMLVCLRGPWGWSIICTVWALAIVGTVYKLLCLEKWPAFSVGLYIAMGWLAIVAIKPMLELMPGGALIWLVAGGVAYTVGVIFYVWERLPFNHAIWHGFVSAGSVCHFLAVLWYVLPVTNA
jgi:hemolysin III